MVCRGCENLNYAGKLGGTKCYKCAVDSEYFSIMNLDIDESIECIYRKDKRKKKIVHLTRLSAQYTKFRHNIHQKGKR